MPEVATGETLLAGARLPTPASAPSSPPGRVTQVLLRLMDLGINLVAGNVAAIGDCTRTIFANENNSFIKQMPII